MSSSQPKTKPVEGVSANGPRHKEGIVKTKRKKKVDVEAEARKQVVREKIKKHEKQIKRLENGDDEMQSVEMTDLQAQLQAQKDALKLLDEEGDTAMDEADEDVDDNVAADGGPEIIVTGALNNTGALNTNEPFIKQEENSPVKSVKINNFDMVEDLVAQDDALGDDPLSDGEIIEWRPGGRGRNMVLVQWGPPTARIYKEVPEPYAPPGFDKNNCDCLADQRLEDRKQKGLYFVTKYDKPVLQGVAFAYSSSDEHPERLLHPDTKPKRYIPGSYKIRWTKGSSSVTSWETRTTLRRVWGSNPRRADLAIWEAFTKAQGRYSEWKQKQGPSVTSSLSPQPAAQPAPGDTSQPAVQPASGTTQKPAQQLTAGAIPPPAQDMTAGAKPPPAQQLTAGATPPPVQQLTPGATPQPVQQLTPEATPQPAGKKPLASAPTEKPKVLTKEQEKIARLAFTDSIFDMYDGKPTKKQREEAALDWAKYKLKMMETEKEEEEEEEEEL